MRCRWFAASSEVAKTAFGHSQKHTAAIPLKAPSSLCGDSVDIILRVVSKNNSNAVPVVCRLFRGGKNRLRALAKTYRGSSLHFAAAPFFPPRSLAFTQAQATATAETPHGDEMKRTAARGCSCSLVPVVGLEPTRCLHLRILSPVRLPFRHTGINFKAASCDTAFFGGTIRI